VLLSTGASAVIITAKPSSTTSSTSLANPSILRLSDLLVFPALSPLLAHSYSSSFISPLNASSHSPSSSITPPPSSTLPHSKQAWRTFSESLEEWKKVNEGGEFWSLVSRSWGGETGTGHRALLALLHLAYSSKGACVGPKGGG